MSKNETICHGTSKYRFENFISKQNYKLNPEFDSKERVPNDLGDGIYFFGTNDFFKAHICAENYAKKYKKNEGDFITLLFYSIDMKEEYTLDFDDRENQKIFLEARKRLDSKIKKMVKNYKTNLSRKQLDGIVINLILKNKKEEVKVITKETYTAFDNIYENSNFPNGLEICVKDPEILIYKNFKHKKIN